MIYLQLEVVDGDSSVRADGSVHSKAEDIFHRLIRGCDSKFSEQELIFF
jgi:hypothetical protein